MCIVVKVRKGYSVSELTAKSFASVKAPDARTKRSHTQKMVGKEKRQKNERMKKKPNVAKNPVECNFGRTYKLLYSKHWCIRARTQNTAMAGSQDFEFQPPNFWTMSTGVAACCFLQKL